MQRLSKIPSLGARLARGATCGALLALTALAGCGPSEPSKPQGGAAGSVASANPDQQSAGTSAAANQLPGQKPATGRDVLRRMIAAYQNATSYSDKGKLQFFAEGGNEKLVNETFDFCVAYQRPNKVRIEAYRTRLVCDGQKVYASVKQIPNQVLVKDAPAKTGGNHRGHRSEHP